MTATAVLVELLGIVALLLWAVRLVRTGITRAFGPRLRSLVARAANNRSRGFAAGFLVTVALQSSTATALIVASLASRQVLPTLTALAVMLGADVGTTVAAQILSFKPHILSPALLLVGVALYVTYESGPQRHIGRILVGLGLLLLALRLMLETTAPLRESPALVAVIAMIGDEPTIALVVAALLTWLAHSSLATVLLIMSLAEHGVIGPETAFAFVLGANVGGGIAPVVMTLRSEAPGRRAPIGNLVLRTAGALLLLPLVPWIAPYVALLEADVARQVVNFHTAFNLALALAAMPFLGALRSLLEWLLPEPPPSEDPAAPRYLDREALDSPSVALAAAAREALRMGDVVQDMLGRSIDALRTNDLHLINEIKAEDDILDRLHEAIKFYLTEISKNELDQSESRRYQEILSFVTNMEHIGDIVDLNLMEIAEKKAMENVRFSAQGFAELSNIHEKIMEHLQLALSVFMTRDVRLARQLVAGKATVRELERRAYENHLKRLAQGVPDTIQTTSLHLDVIRDLKRINSHLTAVAYPLLEETGELRETRLLSRQEAPRLSGLAPSPAVAKPLSAGGREDR